MSAAPAHTFTRLAIAIVVAALVISATAISYSYLEATVTRTAATVTSTRTTTRTTTLTTAGNSSLTLVTATVITILVDHFVATCTTVSGTRSIVYVPLFPGETTTVTTVYPQHIPQQFQVTLTTDTTVSGSNQTIMEQPDTC